MSTNQQDATRDVLRTVHDFLGGPTAVGDEWRFDFGEHLHSNWGAGVRRRARRERAGRRARGCARPVAGSLHLQIVRSVPSGAAFATVDVRHAGRTVATVQVDMYDARRKLAVIAPVTMVSPDALVADLHNTAADRFQRHVQPLAIEPGFTAPVQQSRQMLTNETGPLSVPTQRMCGIASTERLRPS